MKNDQNIQRNSFIWNAAYGGLNAIQPAFVLFAISRTKELSEAGIVTIGFTIGTLVMILAQYGIRYFQATDTSEEYSFSDYYNTRIITTLGSILLVFIYLVCTSLLGNYSPYKSTVIFEIVLLKLGDAFESVFVGRLQQIGRLDIGSKVATIRIALSTLVIFILIWITHNLLVCFLIGLIVAILLDVILLRNKNIYSYFCREKFDKQKVIKLLKISFPLCVGFVLHNYAGNAPKYLVDYFVTDDIQAISGYIMMPMFVITLLNSFLMQPTVKTLGECWVEKKISIIMGKIKRHVIMIIAASLGVLIVGIFVGLPFLSWLYKVDLTNFREEFILLLIGGTLFTLSAYLIMLLTIIRRQKWIVYGCILASILYIALGKIIVSRFGLLGASWIYIVVNMLMLLVFLLGFYRGIKEKTFGGI